MRFFAPADVIAAKGATAKSQLDPMQARLNHRLAQAKLTSAIGKYPGGRDGLPTVAGLRVVRKKWGA